MTVIAALRSRPLAALVVAIALALATAAAALGVSRGTAGPATTIDISIRYSHYGPSAVTVPLGQPVTFVLHNDDPIDHEWIVGDAALHDRHRKGTEPYHASRPTELTIPAGSTITTVVTFRTPGDLQYICHLPGHEAYGMVGTVTIAGG